MIKNEGIVMSYDRKSVLRGVSFSVEGGQIYGLIGKNGAGKTTLMNIMAGLLSPKAGICTVDGENVSSDKTKPLIGYLPEIPGFHDYLSAGEYIDFLLGDKNIERRKQLLELVELSDNVKIKFMSRGMRQRLGIAAALVNDPVAVLLDEPTSALDPAGRDDVRKILLELKKEGKAIVLSTHILNDMENVCDEVGFLADGVIKKSLKIRDLKNDNSAMRISLSENDPNVAAMLRDAGFDCSFVSQKDIRILNPENQKKLFEVLSRVDTPILGVCNEAQSLDDIFKEVCL